MRTILLIFLFLSYPMAQSLIGGTYCQLDDPSKNFVGCDFSHRDLRGLDLKGANFSHALLIGAQLSDLDLTGSNFSYANLTKAKLEKANLSFADFSNALFTQSSLRGAICHKAIFKQASFTSTYSLQHKTKIYPNLLGADFSHADFQEATLQMRTLEKVNFEMANLKGIHFNVKVCKQVNFSGVNLLEIDYQRMEIATDHSIFEGSDKNLLKKTPFWGGLIDEYKKNEFERIVKEKRDKVNQLKGLKRIWGELGFFFLNFNSKESISTDLFEK